MLFGKGDTSTLDNLGRDQQGLARGILKPFPEFGRATERDRLRSDLEWIGFGTAFLGQGQIIQGLTPRPTGGILCRS